MITVLSPSINFQIFQPVLFFKSAFSSQITVYISTAIACIIHTGSISANLFFSCSYITKLPVDLLDLPFNIHSSMSFTDNLNSFLLIFPICSPIFIRNNTVGSLTLVFCYTFLTHPLKINPRIKQT